MGGVIFFDPFRKQVFFVLFIYLFIRFWKKEHDDIMRRAQEFNYAAKLRDWQRELRDYANQEGDKDETNNLFAWLTYRRFGVDLLTTGSSECSCSSSIFCKKNNENM